MVGVSLCLLLFLSADLVSGHQVPAIRQRTYISAASQRPLYQASQMAGTTDVPHRNRNPFYREPWGKRDHRYNPTHQNGQGEEDASATNPVREQRANRQYDVPQIECPPAEDGMDRFACPSPDRMGRYRCVDDRVLCDGFIDCPNAEDEDRMSCMFYKTTKAHLDVLADALLRWARGRY